MAAETHPSSFSSSDNYNYDVFLSFRGEDTRGNFTDHLYTALVRAGIQTFRDNEELIHGEEIGPRLLKTIEQSRISIPIFSDNYASSKWCLQELAKMMECKKTCGQIVWPVFYKVNPSHVRNQTGCFEKAFLKHKRAQGEEKVMMWRQALKEAANLKGWDSEDPENRYETNLINSVVKRALSELIQITTLQVAKHPIGVDSHVEEVMRMLDAESKGVQFVGIHGMGGIGKTTMAKAIFNKISNQFESRSFLADVRERSQREGLVNLQNKLVSDISNGRNLGIDIVDRGINVIRKTCSNKKVLIILDDVEQDDQLDALAGGRDWFGLGSRIIITTRDEHILNEDRVDKSKIYKPNVLDHNLSLQLFSKHAFGRDQPPQDFRELSNSVVSTAGGLPLSLEVLGSFLRDKRRDTEWKSTLKMLKKFPNDQVQKKLQISYDGLDQFFKDIFLDIACFFIGVDEENIIPAWEDSDHCPRVGIKVLVHKSLVKIDSDNKLWMHDQLRDMGRKIVQQENHKKPGKRSRLWSHAEALNVLKKHEGRRNVEGLFLDFGYEAKNHRIDFDDEAEVCPRGFCDGCIFFFLYLCRGDPGELTLQNRLPKKNFDYEAENYSTEYDYEVENYSTDYDYEAENYSTDSDYEAKNYRIERIVKLPQIDPADLLTKAFEKMYDLRLLQVDHADHDRNNFGHLPQGLKWLSLKGISSKCVPTISHLETLAVLDLSGSDIIDDWNGWQQIQLIRTLKVLDLSRCRLLEGTPHFSCDTNLERLILDECINLVAFHESIGHLKKLVFLSLKCCENLTKLPDSICKISTIRSLILSQCLKLEKLPKELGNIKSLKELIIDETTIEELPDSIGLLEELERLSARYCVNLEKLPNLSNLKSLQALCLSECWKLFEIQGISGLSLLQQIDLENCRMLTLLPELPPGLIKLNIRVCTSMERLPNLSTLKNLKELRLDMCRELAKIEDINGLTLLQELDLTDCIKLQSLPELPSSLIKLNATNCSSIEILPNLSNLKNLQALLLCGCQKLAKIQGISGLSLLHQLDLKICITLQSLPELPPSLIRLDVSSCISMKRLPNLSTLKHLKEFSLVDFSKLAKIEGIDGLTLLQELDSTDCMKLQSLPELPSSLIKLDARYCGSIERLTNLSNLKNLQVLHLCCRNLSEIQDISGLSLLQELDLEDCKMLQYLPGLPPGLIKLEIKGYISMKRLPNLSSLRSLKVLHLNNCMNLANIQCINDLTLLQELYLQGCSKLQSLSELPSSLTRLNVYYCENLFEIQGISDLSLLQILHLHSCRDLQSLPKLPSNLITLDLEDCYNLAKIRGLESLESLIDLRVCGCHTYIKTLQKSVSQGMLPTAAFNEGEICKKYLIPDDDNIKGTIFYFVFQVLQDPASSRPIHHFWPFDRDVFSIAVVIHRNDGKKTIKCSHDLRIEGMNVYTDKDRFYSCYFQGLTWFGFPLKKRDIIHVMNACPQRSTQRVKLKMLDLVIEYEAMEDSQQLKERVIHLITSTSVEREGDRECGEGAGPSIWRYTRSLSI